MSKEWMPKNPCKNCELRPKDETCVGCMTYMLYEKRSDAQKKLLEYLIKNPPDYYNIRPLDTVAEELWEQHLKSMLKQLEDNNE